MRTLVDIKEGQIRQLDNLAEKERRSRSALIREAVADYLERRSAGKASDAFGLWGKGKVDGLSYQQKVRGEW